MRTTEEIKVTSADWLFFFLAIAAVFFGINYALRYQFLEIAKALVTMDVYIGHYIHLVLTKFNQNIEFFENLSTVKSYLEQGFFENIKYSANFKNGGELKIYNYFQGNNYSEFQQIFNDFYLFNATIIIVLFGLFFKAVHYKKNMIGTKIYNKPLMAYYDAIIKTPVRKGIGSKKYVVTNDHQPPALSHNPSYIEGSIKLTLLNDNKNFKEEIRKIEEKKVIYDKYINEMIDKCITLLKKNPSKQKRLIELNNKRKKEENFTIEERKEFNNLKDEALKLEDKKLKLEKEESKPEPLSETEKDKLKMSRLIKSYYSLPAQYNKKRLEEVKTQIEKKRKSLGDGEKIKLSEVEQEVEHYFKLENDKKQRALTKEEEQFLKQTKNTYERNIENYNNKYDEGVFLTPSYYILHPAEGKVPKKDSPESKQKVFETPGINIIVELLWKYILDSYEPDIKRQIKELKKINSGLNTKNPVESQTYELNMQIIEQFEKQLDDNDKSSRVNALKELRARHKYEETYIMGVWEYANTITNLPTGPLVKLKWINPVLWYAFTSLKRPSVFLMGAPIYVMYLYEKEQNKIEVVMEEEESIPENISELGILE